MITTDDKVYNQLVDDLFTAVDREVGMVLEGILPISNGDTGMTVPPLYIYILSHPDNYHYHYISCVVVAASEADARCIHPGKDDDIGWDDEGNWVPLLETHTLQVQKVGIALEDQVASTVLMTSTL